jgi:hypothetical protein
VYIFNLGNVKSTCRDSYLLEHLSLGLYRIPYRVLTISPFTHINMKHWTVFKYHHLSQSLWLAIKVVSFFYWPFWRSLYLLSDIYFLKFNFMLIEKVYTLSKVLWPDDHYTVAVGMQWVCLINQYEIFIIFFEETKNVWSLTHYLGSYECWHKDWIVELAFC